LKKWVVTIVLFILLATVFKAPVSAGKFFNPGADGTPGTWYVGATPDHLDPNAPVILFVQGLNSSARTWFDNNDMYVTAYNAGFQTAFVELFDAGGTSEDMWDNGQLLAELIEEIYQYFGKPLVLVTHSKGGIDAQTALVHYGVYPYVSNVITLSSPHFGSELADLAYSSWAGWLAGILGSRSDATYSLQTSYMNYFRSITDQHPNVNKNNYYTFAGTKWGSFGSSLYWGGLYLSQYGPNDGAVTVESAFLPNGTMVKVGDWNHFTIKEGSSTFSFFAPYLTTSTSMASAQMAAATVEDLTITDQTLTSGQIIRGGPFKEAGTESFLVEKGVETLTINWMSDVPVDTLEVIGPNGKREIVTVERIEDKGIFAGAWHHVAVLQKPNAGTWKVYASDDDAQAYLLVVSLQSDISNDLVLQNKHRKKIWKLETKQKKVREKETKATYSVDFTPYQNGKSIKNRKKLKIKEPISIASEITLPTVTEAGTYQITVEIKGKTKDGYPFERTLLKSVYKDEYGNFY
jgi:triacylglycerol esterase/lipase EstA (alpha/beta hydrolase family)